jgi:NADH-quinone oxidoreductase subunit E
MGLRRYERFVRDLVNRYHRKYGSLISILHDIQAEFGYLPKEALATVVEELSIPESRVWGVVTFYSQFHLQPRGKHLIRVCTGTACHVRGAPRILEEMKRCLQIGAGETTKDLLFTLETVNCLGACALGPLAVIDGRYYGKLSAAMVKGILDTYRDGADE